MYAILVCFLICFLIFYFSGRLLSSNDIENYTIFDSFFIGISIITGLLSYWSLIFPLNFFSFLFVFIFSIAVFILKFKFFKIDFKNIKKKRFNKVLTLGIIGTITVVVYSTLLPKTFDSYLYHINAIIWNEKFSVIPGLANLHDRYGFNSASFIFNASFSFNFAN